MFHLVEIALSMSIRQSKFGSIHKMYSQTIYDMNMLKKANKCTKNRQHKWMAHWFILGDLTPNFETSTFALMAFHKFECQAATIIPIKSITFKVNDCVTASHCRQIDLKMHLSELKFQSSLNQMQ